jgi:hypothetical protein
VSAGSAGKRLALLLLWLAICTELAAFAGAALLRSRGYFHRPHEDLSDYESYLGRRDELLGWLTFDERDVVDASGSRPIPAFPDPGRQPPCVSLFGDSFTWADEVSDEEAWSNVLSKRLGCRVANYGVRAYGTDQAFLRFRERHRGDPARVVILAHLSENVVRNVSRDFDLLYGNTKYGLKPRFGLSASGDLELEPLPRWTREEFARVNEDPEAMLPGDVVLLPRFRFPYTLALLRALQGPRLATRLGAPYYARFYEPDHPSRALAITAEILAAFCREARARGQTPLVVLLPTHMDLVRHREKGTWTYEPLREELERRRTSFYDVGPPLAEIFDSRGEASIFAHHHHYDAHGNEILARLVHEELARRAVFPRGAAF